ncbi:hypothetical protein SASPL_111855 [Salvia splendens]|uniref:Transmembrane protein n=1 Tax=Salvia splendens TaxID=180675 RepID=A0A8X8Y9P7_SALSN|nr:hypothetical protein SASPL_111855 [Salvia splendens]
MTSSGEAFPTVELEKELHPGSNKEFEVDSVSSAVEKEAAERKERERKDALRSFKKAIIVSGIVVAVAGAVFTITKKIREKTVAGAVFAVTKTIIKKSI